MQAGPGMESEGSWRGCWSASLGHLGEVAKVRPAPVVGKGGGTHVPDDLAGVGGRDGGW